MATEAANSSEWVMRRTAFRAAIDSRRRSLQRVHRREVQADGRLVEHQHREGPDDSARDGGLLPHPAGELGGEEVGAFLQAERAKQVVAPLREVLSVHTVGRGYEMKVIADGQILIEIGVVGNVAEVLARRQRLRFVIEREAGDPDPTLRRFLQAADQLGGGGLAAAVRAHEGDALAGDDGEVEGLQSRDRPVVAAEAVGLEQDLCGLFGRL